jgi:hypothetical protein
VTGRRVRRVLSRFLCGRHPVAGLTRRPPAPIKKNLIDPSHPTTRRVSMSVIDLRATLRRRDATAFVGSSGRGRDGLAVAIRNGRNDAFHPLVADVGPAL